MTWQQLLKKLKELGYKGGDADLAAVRKFVDDEMLDLDFEGKAIDLDGLHKAATAKKRVSLDGAVHKDEAEQLKVNLKAAQDELEAAKEALELKGLNKPKSGEVNKAVHDVTVGEDRFDSDPKGGFKSFGHFLIDAIRCPGVSGPDGFRAMPHADSNMGRWLKSYNGRVMVEAEEAYKAGVINKATLSTYSNETTGADGGIAVPPEYRTGIMNRVEAPESIAARCDRATLSGNSISVNIDETTPWQTTGGILTYWIGETTAITQSKLALKQRDFRLRKIAALCPLTEELQQDASFLGSYITKKAGDKLGFAVDKAILFGDGVTQPTGIVGHSGTKSITKETNQTATTIKASNIQKMWMGMPAQNRRRSFWIANEDTQLELQRMFVQGRKDSNTFVAAGSLVYLPANGLVGQPNDTLMGRPILYHQAAQTLGTVGDLNLFDPESYLICTKAAGVETASSIHLWFDQAVNALRFLYRVEGQPWWTSTISALNGSETYAAFVTLATRA